MQICSRFFSILIITVMLSAMLPLAVLGEDFESLMIQREVSCILEHGDKVIGGLSAGGLLIWDREDPAQVTRLSAGEELSGNKVTDLADTGRHLWVATMGGGMTCIVNFNTRPEYRQFINNLGSLDITAVTGEVVGSSERVYYAMDAGGLGLVTDWIGGAVFTAEQDGLINNNINDLQLYEGVLYIATPTGICSFENNTFTNRNAGLSDLDVTDLVLDPDGNLVAGGAGGVYVWDADSESWTNLAWTSGVRGLSSNGTHLWGLSWNNARFYNGSGWTNVTLPRTGPTAIFAGEDIWVGGRYRTDEMSGSLGLAWYGEFDGVDSFSDHIMDASIVRNAYSLVFDGEGTVWSGSYTGQAYSGLGGDEAVHVAQVASAENDSSGIFQRGANMLASAYDSMNDILYTSQYTKGIVRHDLTTGELNLMYGGTCGLEDVPWLVNSSIVSLVAHPDGTLLVMYDKWHDQKLRILTDPIHWRGDNWYNLLPQYDGEEVFGIWDAVVQRNDVIWFAVQDVGLMRWDINGYSAGPDDEITWTDYNDDRWDGPYREFDDTDNDPGAEMTRLALAPDGSIWFGGNGVARVSYDEVFGAVTVEEEYGTKTSAYEDGLIDGSVKDIEVDGNGDLWVSTVAGLNRVRWNTKQPEIDAFFDLGNYLSNDFYPILYSPNVITGLPGGVYAKLAVSADGKRMALSSSEGTVAWDIVAGPGQAEETLSSMYCYPNPWTPGDALDSGLKLSGISADAINGDGAIIEVYNLAGQLVYRNSHVSTETSFWDGNNRVGQPVATGMYMVKVSWRGLITTRTVAVVR